MPLSQTSAAPRYGLARPQQPLRLPSGALYLALRCPPRAPGACGGRPRLSPLAAGTLHDQGLYRSADVLLTSELSGFTPAGHLSAMPTPSHALTFVRPDSPTTWAHE